MNSTVAIYNTALARLGGHQLERVNSPDDDGTVPTLCRTLFPHVVDVALASCPWSFATRRASLAQKPDDGPPGYPLRYALPADCLYPLRLDVAGLGPARTGGERGAQPSGMGTGGEIADHFPPSYILEGADLLTNVATPVLAYVARLRDPALFTPLFADAVAWALAAELSTALVNDVRRQQLCLQKYEMALHDARTADARSQHPLRHAGPWIEARN